jgi:uncharacterized iron-regulated membrane protein
MYKFFFKVHLWASIILFPLILVFAITGIFMAFEPEIDHLAHAKLSYVEPGPKVLSLAALGEKAHQAFPKDTINFYNLSTSPDISYEVYTNTRSIYVNQYTGEIMGTMTGPDFWETTQNNIHQLHLRLGFFDKNKIGESIMSWTGVVLLVILPSGLILWWRQKRVSVRWKEKPRLFWFDFHSLIGVTAFIVLIILTFTGVMIGFENKTVPMFYALTGSKRAEMPEIKITAPINTKAISPDSALQIARTALPGVAPFNINVPAATEAYMVRCRYPEDRTPGGRSRVMIEPYTGKVLFAEGSRTAPAGTRMVNMNRAIHTGDIFGMFSKIIVSLASLSMGLQVLSGLRMWWLRKWKKKKSIAPVE